MGQLDGRVAIVTGTSSGIGNAVASRFVDEGAIVTGLSRSETAVAGVSWVACDVTDSASVDDAVARVVREHGRLDIAVNNAGAQIEKTIAETSDQDFDMVMDVNVRGLFFVARAAVRVMAAGDGGSIINIGSTAADSADHAMAVYNASKGAVHSLSRAIATDHGRDGIRCNVVAPGWVATAMADAAFDAMADPDEARRLAVGRHPIGRLGLPRDVAGLCVWLAGDDAGYATGSVFKIDGGLTAQSPIGGD